MIAQEESKESIFLKKYFKQFYEKNFVDTVSSVEKREFGYGVFNRKIANRNLSFSSPQKMNDFLREKVPLFFSYSNSYYLKPSSTPMQTKNWIGGDLIYEFDADEITTECEYKNNFWHCKKKFGQEAFIDETENKGETKQWFLKKGLLESKKQVFRLVEFLEKDFGFDRKGIHINFSGKAGYHVHFKSSNILELNKKARIELVDYITGKDIYFDNLGYDLENSLSIPKEKCPWQKRINIGLKEFFEKDASEIAQIVGLKNQRSKIQKYLNNKNDLLKKMDQGHLIGFNLKKNKEFFSKIFEYIVNTYSVPIDRQTSIDIHKIIRVPNTLHGDTGLLAKKIEINELDSFDPYLDGVVFGDENITLFVNDVPKFKLKGNSFGPYKDEEINVPLYAAIYLIGKGAKLK